MCWAAEGMTQREIGELLDWGKNNTSNYSILLEKVSPRFLDLSKAHQIGRGDSNSPRVDGFSFTEGWFRTSGLYDLNEEFQLLFFDKFKADNFNWNKSKVQQITAKFKLWQGVVTAVLHTQHSAIPHPCESSEKFTQKE